MKTKLKLLDKAKIDTVIGMAWDDRCSFERIEKGFGLVEKEVIELMRNQLKPGSFRRWRRRVTGRATKHRKRFKQSEGPKGSFE